MGFGCGTLGRIKKGLGFLCPLLIARKVGLLEKKEQKGKRERSMALKRGQTGTTHRPGTTLKKEGPFRQRHIVPSRNCKKGERAKREIEETEK